MAENTEDTGVVAEQNEAEASLQPITLTVGDIETAVKAIDHACAEGAYKGWPLINEVFTNRNRLVQFLRQVSVPVSPAEEEAPQ
jgi:hypothetical protein